MSDIAVMEGSIPFNKYTFRPSLPDHRDIVADTTSLRIHAEVDPRKEMQSPYDQGQLGSCDPNAWVGAAVFNMILDGVELPEDVLSRLFVYYLGRVIEGTVSYDSGLQGRTGGRVLRSSGAPLEHLWPYDIGKFQFKPSEEAYQAEHYKIGQYVHPGLGMSEEDRIDAFKRVLSNKQTIPFGFTVYEGLESEKVAREGVLPMPQKGEKVLGGHETVIVGYLKEEPDYCLVRNSWGTEWGLNGYFLMPWKYAASTSYASDWRSIHRPAGK